ncbi:3'5'-cyclic nucleotide phosphodiesterase catalytic domain [Trinorchestia longiramus]|nr:3'5'-cyclic nucleotide phosphodiesterase catalytic domain [Trinorchestia longiramus]
MLPAVIFEFRLRAVEQTVAALRSDLPPVVSDLRRAVDTFRHSLEVTHVASLPVMSLPEVCGGESIPCPRSYRASSHPYWERVHYRRKLDEDVTHVFARFREIWDSVVEEETAQCLRLPTFNNWAWEDWEVILLLQHMYQDLGLLEKFDIDIDVLRNFLSLVYLHYNQVPFHNFQHAFCVTQMMYGLICKCGLQERLGDLDVMILLTSCICHDLDHPGFNNIYQLSANILVVPQINARTELALRYNDISPLENHHCSIAFQILERHQCNIFRNVSPEEYRRIREGVIRCILATDMARHNEILRDFQEVNRNFDFSNRAHVNLLFMILIKVADISNEARPLDIAEPWLECLMQEFFNQSDLEKLEGLPVSPFMDREKVTKPTSQCAFIGFVLLPLFEALGEVLPELEDLIIKPVRYALDHYKRLKDMNKRPSEVRIEQMTQSLVDDDDEVDGKIQTTSTINESPKRINSAPPNESHRLSQDIVLPNNNKEDKFMSLRSSGASSKSSLLQRSLDASSTMADPNDSSDHLDTPLPETEVEVMERTSRFKISTEAPLASSQKSSFERRPSWDDRLSADGKNSYDSTEDRSHKTTTRVGAEGRGRDTLGMIGRLYSKEVADDHDHCHLLMKNASASEINKLAAKRARTKIVTCSLDEESNNGGDSGDNRFFPSSFSEQDDSLMTRFTKLAGTGRKSCVEISSDEDSLKHALHSSNGVKAHLKKTRSKSVADQPNTIRTYSLAKSKINFRLTNPPCTVNKVDEAQLIGTGSRHQQLVSLSIGKQRKESHSSSVAYVVGSASPSDNFSPSGSVSESTKKSSSDRRKLSVSMDILPSGHNDKFNRSGEPADLNPSASSEDNLIKSQSQPTSAASSPKTPKKKNEASRNLIWSLLKKSPTAKEEQNKPSRNSL